MPQAAIVGQGMGQEAGGAVDALIAIRRGWHVRRRQPAEPGTRRYTRHHGRGDTQRLRNAAHRVAVPAQADDSLGCAAGDHRGRAMWPRAAVRQASGPFRKKRYRHLRTVLRSMTLTPDLDAAANGRVPPAYRK
jgi:hypothetical protein